MPELPEVETVRAGLADHVQGRLFERVDVFSPRAVRHHAGGAAELIDGLLGHRITAVRRRGKFCWLELGDSQARSDRALVIHLGMSGQVLVRQPEQNGQPPSSPHPLATHTRIRAVLSGPMVVDFVDQRTFGYWLVDELIPTVDDPGDHIPSSAHHIARDLIDPRLDPSTPAASGLVTRMGSSSRAIKHLLLDQTIISGIGNIYADEALWRSQMHYLQPGDTLKRAQIVDLLNHCREVLADALTAGGTSFDALYVNVNGASGYFDRSLNAYGRQGQPCLRCDAPMVRQKFAGRSSHFCPNCQRRW